MGQEVKKSWLKVREVTETVHLKKKRRGLDGEAKCMD